MNLIYSDEKIKADIMNRLMREGLLGSQISAGS